MQFTGHISVQRWQREHDHVSMIYLLSIFTIAFSGQINLQLPHEIQLEWIFKTGIMRDNFNTWLT